MFRNCFAGATAIAPAVLLFALQVLPGAPAALGQDVIRVEEDWEFEICDPDSNSVGPQVLATMSPFDHLAETHFTLEINHRSAPSWTPGGISIHRWTGEWRNASFDRSDRTIMNTSNEVVTWTQALYVESGRLHFKVFNGTSTTWGSFGHSNLLKLDTSWAHGHLNGYTPAVSVAESGASYAGNRLHYIKIKQIRLTLSDSSVLTDNTERIVLQQVQ